MSNRNHHGADDMANRATLQELLEDERDEFVQRIATICEYQTLGERWEIRDDLKDSREYVAQRVVETRRHLKRDTRLAKRFTDSYWTENVLRLAAKLEWQTTLRDDYTAAIREDQTQERNYFKRS